MMDINCWPQNQLQQKGLYLVALINLFLEAGVCLVFEESVTE